MIITKKRYNSEINKAFLKGYDLGKKEGETTNLLSTYTPNEIRKACGFPPLERNKDE